jgi:hypothetical protein
VITEDNTIAEHFSREVYRIIRRRSVTDKITETDKVVNTILSGVVNRPRQRRRVGMHI